jgi:hypothetical protein
MDGMGQEDLLLGDAIVCGIRVYGYGFWPWGKEYGLLKRTESVVIGIETTR